MDVARRSALVHRVLGHERDRTSELAGDLLGAVLVDDVAIGHLERVGVAQVDLVLARTGFPFRELDRDARVVHAVADRPDDVLVACRLQDVVVLHVRCVIGQAAELFRPRLLVRLFEEVELELGAALDLVAQRRGPLELAAQHLAG